MNKWYKIKIFNQEVNWATFVLSATAFIGFEIYRRKKIKEQIEKEVQLGIAQFKEEQGTIIDQVVRGVDNLDWEAVLEDIT